MVIRGQPITFSLAIPIRFFYQPTAHVIAVEATLRDAEQPSTRLWRSDERASCSRVYMGEWAGTRKRAIRPTPMHV